MEMEFFVKPGEDEEWHQYWIDERTRWYTDLGIDPANLRHFEHPREKLSHYAKRTVDIEYRFKFAGSEWGELEGIANRTDFDLSTHAEHSGKDLSYFDQASGERYVPYVIEPAAGLSRSLMTFLVDAYTEDEAPNTKGGVDKRTVLRLDPRLAPVKVAVLPLSPQRGPLAEGQGAGRRAPRQFWNVEFDDAGAIGKRYRRQDEIGTPYCVTVDFDTLEDDAVTVRERDSMAQERITPRRRPHLVRRAPRRLLSRARDAGQMPTNNRAGGHNDGVTPPLARRARRRPARAVLPGLVVAALVLSGCGGGDGEEKKPASAKASATPSVSLPIGNVKVPEGVTLTKAGTTLELRTAGDRRLRAEHPAQLGALDDGRRRRRPAGSRTSRPTSSTPRTKASRPYYVRVDGEERRHRRPRAGRGAAAGRRLPQHADPALELQQHLHEVPLDAAAGRVHREQVHLPLPGLPGPRRRDPDRDELPAAPGLRADRVEGGHQAPGDPQEEAHEEEEGQALNPVPTPLRLGPLEVATPVVLAPMAGITNAAYRRLCSEQGARLAGLSGASGLYVCEMITSRGPRGG